MRSRTITTTIACCGALAYIVSKIELAIRGRIGMPGFPAPAESYLEIPDPTAAQFGNAAMGVLLLALTATLYRPPRRVILRRILLGLNGVGVVMIAVGVAGFTLRAAGAAPRLGEPAVGVSTWVALGVGAVWTVAWSSAVIAAGRGTNRNAPAPRSSPRGME